LAPYNINNTIDSICQVSPTRASELFPLVLSFPRIGIKLCPCDKFIYLYGWRVNYAIETNLSSPTMIHLKLAFSFGQSEKMFVKSLDDIFGERGRHEALQGGGGVSPVVKI